MNKCTECKHNGISPEEKPCNHCKYNQMNNSDCFESVKSKISVVEDWYKKRNYSPTLVGELEELMIKNAFYDGIKQGRFERDNEIKPLLRLLACIKPEISTHPDHIISKILKIYKELKPLNEERECFTYETFL